MKNKISAAFFTIVMAATMLAAVSVSGCGEVEPPPVVTPPYVPDAPAVTDSVTMNNCERASIFK